MATNTIKITECPRDAMQGLSHFVPTDVKAEYINLLLQVGFDTIDFGSFVSPKAIPQMRDTADVLSKLQLNGTTSKLLAIIANYRGAVDACRHGAITYIGYPFSLSESFQLRNTNTSVADAFDTVKRINELSGANAKQMVIYLSMGFGNPYGDEWSVDIIEQWTQKLVSEGINIIALADTIGVATAHQIRNIYPALTKRFTKTEFGLHLHSTPETASEKIKAAYESGCRRFDSALRGYGGCPMAKDELTGNIATEKLIDYLRTQNALQGLNFDKLQEALEFSAKVFRT